MKIQTLLLFGAIYATSLGAEASVYNCMSPRPEMAGFHNMVLFGAPNDEMYVYHLPLFTGNTNGVAGHVLMHVYQGLWKVKLDSETKSAYDLKFSKETTPTNPFPFFSIGPKSNRFKVPEMICNPNFSLSALTVFGHIESNPEFPKPTKLRNGLSVITVKGEPVLARKFEGAALSALTYLIFGTSKQHYMVHFLTDDENSFDQIVAIEILDSELRKTVERDAGIFVSIPISSENELTAITENAHQISPNNKWKLPVSTLGKVILTSHTKSSLTGKIKVIGEIYFNTNDDLKK